MSLLLHKKVTWPDFGRVYIYEYIPRRYAPATKRVSIAVIRRLRQIAAKYSFILAKPVQIGVDGL